MPIQIILIRLTENMTTLTLICLKDKICLLERSWFCKEIERTLNFSKSFEPTCKSGWSVYTAGPVRLNKILILPVFLVTVHYHRRSFGSESILKSQRKQDILINVIDKGSISPTDLGLFWAYSQHKVIAISPKQT